ncbi:hypothetical protein SAMN04487792_1671 [Lactobacillus bombicola]|uniref:Uncharacterized protein n=1 Tax=Lactobacillus bombicola TaxID=1505723 RepID=A0A1I1TX93_9LACO|nr:hypothetical protein [Lactobacillus bombicola]SFD63227.1 hypothetical protein SAMN04487792_1671 [Lactobacillus bombicola]
MALSEAKKRANARWNAKNKEKQLIYTTKSAAKRFVKEFADEDELKELEQLIAQRRVMLRK